MGKNIDPELWDRVRKNYVDACNDYNYYRINRIFNEVYGYTSIPGAEITSEIISVVRNRLFP